MQCWGHTGGVARSPTRTGARPAPPGPGAAHGAGGRRHQTPPELHPLPALPSSIPRQLRLVGFLPERSFPAFYFFFSKELKPRFKGRRGAAASQRDREERTRARRLSFFRALRALPDLSHQARAGVGQVSAPAAPWQGMIPFNLSGVTPFRFPLSSSFPLKTRILRG